MKLKTTIFIKCLTLWNWLSDSLCSVKNKVSNFYSHILLYFRKDNDLWYIVQGFNLPFKNNNLYNVKSEWVYDVSKNRLSKEVNEGEVKEFTRAWLSTKLVVNNEENDMDAFFDNLCVVTTENELPTMHTILLAWCIYKKQWYLLDDSIVFHIIDHLANDEVISYESNCTRSSFKANKNKLYLL